MNRSRASSCRWRMLVRGLGIAAVTICLGLHSPGARAEAKDRAFEVVRKLGPGINILGYDGLWDGGTDAPFKLQYFRLIREAGFRHVRINLFAFKYMDSEAQVAPLVLRALDRVVEQSIRNGLIPIIDEHDVDECQRGLENCSARLLAFWRQIASRYAGKYPEAVFEILNEPGGNLTQADWNGLALDVLKIIRAFDRNRTVIVAGLNSSEPQDLRALDLPEDDRNIILTVHYYKPFSFTHQGAPWAPEAGPAGVRWGSEADRSGAVEDFLMIDRWAAAQRRPVYLGEFGVYEKAGIADRAEYLSFVARSAERLGWSWACWQFDHDFAIFDTDRGRWIAPLLRSLLPGSAMPKLPARSN